MIRNPLVVGIVLAGVLATFVAATAMRRSTEARASQWLGERAEIVREAVSGTVLAFSDGLQSIRAFMEVTPDVDEELFTDYVSRLDERLGLIGIAYLGIVSHEDTVANLTLFSREVLPRLRDL